MSIDTQPPDTQTAPDARLGQFLAWLIPTVFGFAILLAITFAIFRDRLVGITGAVLFSYGCLLLVARAQLRRSKLEATVATICIGLLATDLSIKLVEPISPPTLVVVPLLAVAIALPYIRERALRRLIIACLLVTIIVAILEEWSMPAAGLPLWLIVFFRAGSLIAVVALILLLLWQFSSQLTETLARIQAANAALRESDARYRAISELTSDFVYSVSIASNGQITLEWLTDAATRITGYTPAELRLRSTLEALTFPDRRHSVEQTITLLRSGRTDISEFPILTKSGETRWLRHYAQPEWDAVHERVVRVVGAVQDITERKRVEEQRLALERKLLETQKFESLAVLAGGIAHDFNNLLAIVLGNAELALLDLPPESPTREAIVPIISAVQRALALTQQMLDYSGRGGFSLERIDLNALLTALSDRLRAAIAETATLLLRLAPDLPPAEADAAQIRQLVMNLVINAAEAIGNTHGTITLATGFRHADRAYLAQTYLAPDLAEGEYVYLEVADTGRGIDAAILPKVFEPFFTTKFIGRGLGLAVVLGIVRGHKGALMVQSEPGHGATFTVLLPRALEEQRGREAEGQESGSRPAPLPLRPSATGTAVLIVDDEEGVRMVMERALERAGFTVLAAADGRAGVEMFRAHVDTIACVLLDLMMPLMNGEEVFREIRRIKPDACVILMSGYNEQEAISRFAGQQPTGFLQKPFSPQKLRDMLRRVLGQV